MRRSFINPKIDGKTEDPDKNGKTTAIYKQGRGRRKEEIMHHATEREEDDDLRAHLPRTVLLVGVAELLVVAGRVPDTIIIKVL